MNSQENPIYRSLLELDRLLHCIIAALGELGDKRLAFKGGTFLRVCVFSEYRFSEDLDFDFAGTPHAFEQLMNKAVALASEEAKTDMVVVPGKGPNLRIEWGARYKKNEIKVEATFLSSVKDFPPTKKYPLQPRWDDNRHSAIEILGYQPESVASDKLKCLARRGKARDVYDLYRLIGLDQLDKSKAFRLYLKTWNDPKREYGWRPHPSELRGAYSGRKAKMAAEWKELTDSGSVSADIDFQNIFNAIDRWIAREITDWKKFLPQGELDRQKRENMKERKENQKERFRE